MREAGRALPELTLIAFGTEPAASKAGKRAPASGRHGLRASDSVVAVG
ncbi:hypothetical protein Pla111_16320 [Botrimarina hoheduenensis]|uniref:Uncharacterized protein n=1 Tax=Botrimarina hoheduenensis TaxID=2528000 RepID=A0A5C5W6M2_9BACT|nr:hypothetical protein Pla111_16320 [Botrimarina hoheduenensis]